LDTVVYIVICSVAKSGFSTGINLLIVFLLQNKTGAFDAQKLFSSIAPAVVIHKKPFHSSMGSSLSLSDFTNN